MAGPVASFYAQVGINTRLQDLRKVDRYLNLIERKLQRFSKKLTTTLSLNISSFQVDSRRLTRTLGNALDKASKDVVFEVSRFAVNERNLRAAMIRAGRSFAREAVPYQSSLHRANTAVTRHERPQLADRSGRNFMYGGGTAGALARYGVGSVPFIGGAYGLMTLNRGSQELQANAMALSASAGNEADTRQYAEFLNNLGDRLGKKTSVMTPFFAQMLAGSKGTALEPHLMSGFESLMEYSSVMMLDEQKIKGTIRAFTQMIGKQQIMAEELRGQAAEHLPPIVRLMADVAAGGDTKKLNKMMEMGQLDPNVHLPLLFARLKQEAEPLLPKYFKTSVFAQGLMSKKFEDLLKTFGASGGDEGFARGFRAVADAASRLTPVVEALGKSFNWLSQQIEGPLTLLGDLGYHFSNIKNTLDNLNPNIMKFAALGGLLMTKWGRIASVFYGLYMVLEDISVGIMGGESLTGKFFTFLEKFVQFDKGIMGVAMAFLAVAASLKIVAAAGALASGSIGGAAGGKGGFLGKALKGAGIAGVVGGGAVVGLDAIGFFDRMDAYRDAQSTPEKRAAFMQSKAAGQWNGIDDYLAFQADKRAALQEDVAAGIITPEQAMAQMGMTSNTSNSIQNTFQINIEGVIDPANMENVFNEQILPQVEGWWTNQLGEVNTSFGSK